MPVCPEVLGGLTTPRPAAELCGTADGADVLAGEPGFKIDGDDVTAAYRRGAEAAVAVARAVGATRAVLKARSPSCGSSAVYDGTFSRSLVPGKGVTAAALRAAGIEVSTRRSSGAMARWRRFDSGRLAQLEERRFYTAEVGGSSPSAPTTMQTVTLVLIGDSGPDAGQPETELADASGGLLHVVGRAGGRPAGVDLVRRRRPDVACVGRGRPRRTRAGPDPGAARGLAFDPPPRRGQPGRPRRRRRRAQAGAWGSWSGPTR